MKRVLLSVLQMKKLRPRVRGFPKLEELVKGRAWGWEYEPRPCGSEPTC